MNGAFFAVRVQGLLGY